MILPPHTHAAQSLGATKETTVPHGWPAWRVPNFSEWREGDVVLVHAAHWAIPAAQNFSPQQLMNAGSNWSHAGIYVGDGQIVDAVDKIGVVMQSVWNYCQYRALRVRRVNVPNIPAANIQDIAALARTHIGKPYSRQQVLLGYLGLANHPHPDKLYCSTLVGWTVDQATGLDLSHDPAWQPLYPGTLASHPWLSDIDVEWRDY